MSKSKKDPNQIMQYEHDDVTNSKRMSIVGGEMAIELNADDGDSVQTEARCDSFNMQNGDMIDISKYSRMKMYMRKDTGGSKSNTKLSISPEMDGDWFMPPTLDLTPPTTTGASLASQEVSVMGMRAKLECDEGVTVVIVCKGL